MDDIEEHVETATGRLRPFWGRIMVIPSVVDGEDRDSGLFLPYTGDHTPVKRGVVAHIDRNVQGEASAAMDEIAPGSVVYYLGGLKVLDCVMLSREEIVAYEVGDG